MNPHKSCELKNIWFKKDQYQKLIQAIEENDKDTVLDIIWDLYGRGEL